jgi:hypothetical protein
MHLRFRIGALIAILSLATLPLLARAKIVHRWVRAGAPVPRFQKILVACIGDNLLLRQEFEDEMKRLLAAQNVEGVQSYLVLPPRNEMMERELKQRIKESSLDSVLVVRSKAVGNGPEDAAPRGAYAPPSSYSAFWPFWNQAYGDPPTASSDPKESIFVRLEFNFYSIKDEKLVWSGETNVLKSRNLGKLVDEYAQTLVRQLKKDKIIRKK